MKGKQRNLANYSYRHTRERLLERYDLPLLKRDYEKACDFFRKKYPKKKGKQLEKQIVESVSFVELGLAERPKGEGWDSDFSIPVLFVYSTETELIQTVLPRK